MHIFTSKTSVFLLLLSLTAYAFTSQKDDLAKAKRNIRESASIRYHETAHYPIPETDLVDTIHTEVQYSSNVEDALGYNYIRTADNYDLVYQNEELSVSSHADSIVRIYLPRHYDSNDAFKKEVDGSFRRKWSPMTLLEAAWEPLNDTVMNQASFSHYYRVVNDKVYNGNKIRTEQHIFIDQSTYLLTLFFRRNYFNGALSQEVSLRYTHYQLSKIPASLKYELPENYISAYGQKEPLVGLQVGEVAPNFQALSMAGDSIILDLYKGKKVLLNFSIISCGYCKMSLAHFNQPDYELSDDISVLYINPADDQARMETYRKRMNIPFPAIVGVAELGKKYKLNSYPRYFLVNEEGIIEQIEIGYSKTFIDQFSK